MKASFISCSSSPLSCSSATESITCIPSTKSTDSKRPQKPKNLRDVVYSTTTTPFSDTESDCPDTDDDHQQRPKQKICASQQTDTTSCLLCCPKENYDGRLPALETANRPSERRVSAQRTRPVRPANESEHPTDSDSVEANCLQELLPKYCNEELDIRKTLRRKTFPKQKKIIPNTHCVQETEPFLQDDTYETPKKPSPNEPQYYDELPAKYCSRSRRIPSRTSLYRLMHNRGSFPKEKIIIQNTPGVQVTEPYLQDDTYETPTRTYPNKTSRQSECYPKYCDKLRGIRKSPRSSFNRLTHNRESFPKEKIIIQNTPCEYVREPFLPDLYENPTTTYQQEFYPTCCCKAQGMRNTSRGSFNRLTKNRDSQPNRNIVKRKTQKGPKTEASQNQCDYEAHYITRVEPIRPEDHCILSNAKFEELTTYRSAFLPYKIERGMKVQKGRPDESRKRFSDMPFEAVSTYRSEFVPKPACPAMSMKPIERPWVNMAQSQKASVYREDYRPFYFLPRCVDRSSCGEQNASVKKDHKRPEHGDGVQGRRKVRH